jgi:hypothetical protein
MGDVPERQPRLHVEDAGDCSDPGHPSKKRYFAVTKKTHSSLQTYYDAVIDAQKSGQACYWTVTAPVKSVEKDAVFLRCKLCQSEYSVKSPSVALKNHFVQREDRSWTCKYMQQAQNNVDANRQLGDPYGAKKF